MKLNFITKKRTRTSEDDLDVSIKVTNSKEERKRDYVQFAFKNNCFRAISDTGFVVVAIEGNRLYFKGETKELGFKLSKSTKETNRFTRIKDDNLTIWVKDRQGEYPLLFDKEHHLFFIETEEEKNGIKNQRYNDTIKD